MDTGTRKDQLIQRLEAMNELLNLREDASDANSKKKSRGKKDGKAGSGSFGAVGTEMFFRRNFEKRPGILGITHPSDGHPQEELTPDFGWFRALAYNNPTWTLFWPELII